MINALRKWFSESHAIKNIAWLYFDKIVRMSVVFFIYTIIAKKIGPESFGQLNIATSIVGVIAVFVTAGLGPLVISDSIGRSTAYKDRLQYNSMFIVFSLSIIFLLGIIVYRVSLDDPSLISSLVLVNSLALIFKCSDVARWRLESEVKSKYAIFIDIIGTIFFASVISILVINNDLSVMSVMVVVLIESCLVGALLILLISRRYSRSEFSYRLDFGYQKQLIKKSWPLIFSAAAWMIYTRVDTLMLGYLDGNESAGIYSAATRISEVSNFIITGIVVTMMPYLAKEIRDGVGDIVNNKVVSAYSIIIYGSLLVAVIGMFCSEFAINILYGDMYKTGVDVLRIYFMSVVFLSVITFSGRHMVMLGMQRELMYRHVAGLAINIPLNYILIPKFGMNGAAISTVFSLFVVAMLFDGSNKSTRILMSYKFRSLNPNRAFKILKW